MPSSASEAISRFEPDDAPADRTSVMHHKYRFGVAAVDSPLMLRRMKDSRPEVRPITADGGEEGFRVFFDAIWIGFAESDLEGRMLRVNAGFCRITGYAEHELVGRRFGDITHSADQERDRLAFRHFVESGASTYQVEKRYVRKDGTTAWVQVNVNIVRDQAGRAVRAAAAVQDITARKEAEAIQAQAIEALRESERQQRMFAAVGELGSRLANTEDLIEAIGRCVATEFRVSRCGFAYVDVTRGQITVTNDFHGDLPSLAGVYAIEEYASYYLDDALAGRVVTVDDTAVDSRTSARFRTSFEPLALRAHLTVPLHRAGKWVAVFWITHHEPHRWTQGEVDTMKLVSERAWAVIEGKRAEGELRASEERFRSVVENMSEGLMLFNPAGDLIYQNLASLRIHGFASGQIRLRNDEVPVTWKAWDENERPISFEEWPVSRVFRMERFQNQVLRVVRVETGHEFFGSYNGSPICDASGKLLLGFITIRDITQEIASRRRLRAFFESDMMGAIYWTIDGRITDANRRFLRMIGYTREELLGGWVSWANLTPPEYGPQDEYALRELRETGLDTPYEKEYIRKDGTRVPILIGASMLDERRHEGVAFVLDISERRRAEQALRESEQQFRVLADSMPNLAWSANADGHITWYNQRWYEYTGTTPEQMVGWGWQSVHDPAMLPRVLERWGDALATRRPFEMEFPLRGADGTFRWFLTRVTPMQDETGRVSRWFGTNTDVTAIREAREVLAKSKEQLEAVVAERTAQLEEVVRELSTFSYSVSHDLRAPLRTITGFADLLRNEFAAALPGEARSYVDRIHRAGHRMDRLITDVLHYTKVSRAELNIEDLEPEPVIREVVELISGSRSDATILIEGPFPRVRASRTALAQALTNLINNAVKFTRPGVAPVIKIGAEAGVNVTRLYVQDNGIGIAPEYREKIWGMFERLNSNYDGTGIGLALVKRAVDRMGGRVHVESVVGEGSKFAIELPNA